MKRILVIGGSGFLGSRLCEKLLEQGNEVICVDNSCTGSRRNVYGLMDNPRLRDGVQKTIAYFDDLLRTDPEFCRS